VTGKVWERLVGKYLLGSLPGYAVKKRVVFAVPIGDLLRGFAWDPSGWDARSGYIEAFVQPLYVPVGHIVLSHGERLGGGTRTWEIDPADPAPGMAAVREAVLAEGIPFLDALPDAAALAREVRNVRRQDRRTARDPNLAENLAYSLVVAGDVPAALAELDRIAGEARAFPPEPRWPHEVAGRCALVRRLAAEDPGAALRQLGEWRRRTLADLRLERWATPDLSAKGRPG
jgi:hypothetical protein